MQELEHRIQNLEICNPGSSSAEVENVEFSRQQKKPPFEPDTHESSVLARAGKYDQPGARLHSQRTETPKPVERRRLLQSESTKGSAKQKDVLVSAAQRP